MLLEEVVNEQSKYVTQHMWMPLREQDNIRESFQCGDSIRFDAEVNRYQKGSKKRRRMDYGLCKPANVEHIEAGQET